MALLFLQCGHWRASRASNAVYLPKDPEPEESNFAAMVNMCTCWNT